MGERENILPISALAILISGIITTVVMSLWNLLKRGAKATGRLWKAIYNLGNKFSRNMISLN